MGARWGGELVVEVKVEAEGARGRDGEGARERGSEGA